METEAEDTESTGIIIEEGTVRDQEDVRVSGATTGEAEASITAVMRSEVSKEDDTIEDIITPQGVKMEEVGGTDATTKKLKGSSDITIPTIKLDLMTMTSSSTTRLTTRSNTDRTVAAEITAERVELRGTGGTTSRAAENLVGGRINNHTVAGDTRRLTVSMVEADTNTERPTEDSVELTGTTKEDNVTQTVVALQEEEGTTTQTTGDINRRLSRFASG